MISSSQVHLRDGKINPAGFQGVDASRTRTLPSSSAAQLTNILAYPQNISHVVPRSE